MYKPVGRDSRLVHWGRQACQEPIKNNKSQEQLVKMHDQTAGVMDVVKEDVSENVQKEVKVVYLDVLHLC